MTIGKTIKTAARETADVVHAGTAFVARQEGKIATAAHGCLWALGKAVKGTGVALALGARNAAEAAHAAANRNDNSVARGLLRACAHLGTGVGMVGAGADKLGQWTASTAAPVVGKATGGVVTGAVMMFSDGLDSVALHEADIEALRVELAAYGKVLQQRADVRLAQVKAAQAAGRRQELLDTLVVGGMTLEQIAQGAPVPPEIEKAFELAYPNLAQHETLADAVNHASASQLVGLTDGVKGKLFELKLLDHLNHGGLPDGFHAVLAQSATQPGWDLQVLDPSGHVSSLIQAKATDSVEYVRHALEQYPNIPITSTHEVYAHMAALGAAQHVTDSGVALADLNHDVAAAMTDATHHFGVTSFMPSTLGLAVIALSVLLDRRLTWEMAGREFGARSGKAGVAVGAGKAALVVTQSWWIALLAGVGSRALAAYGGHKRERYQLLLDAVRALRGLLIAPPAVGEAAADAAAGVGP